MEDLPGVPLASQDGPALPIEEGLAVQGVLGTPDFRKYFWARMSVATPDHAAGTEIPSWRKTVEPSGFLISETRCSNWIPA